MCGIAIEGGRVLLGDGPVEIGLRLEGGHIASLDGRAEAGDIRLDATGLLVLPGIVDIHGDAFERQIMPRPGVSFPLDLALLDSDRQLLSNGITTAFHGLTLSWEPGLRSRAAGEAFAAALERTRPRLGSDTRLHIRWETFALDSLDLIEGWLAFDVKPLLAFNDHTTQSYAGRTSVEKLRDWSSRSGLSPEDYKACLEAAWARGGEVGPARERLAAKARRLGVTMLSHDDMSPAMREDFRALGVAVAEFPLTVPTAEAARAAGEHVVLGAPNVVRGGSHIKALNAADAAEAGLCTVLASDYYYPALPQAAWRLHRERGLPLQRAWALVSAGPAEAAGLDDRGVIEAGRRADIVLLRGQESGPASVVATISAGRLVHLADPSVLATLH